MHPNSTVPLPVGAASPWGSWPLRVLVTHLHLVHCERKRGENMSCIYRGVWCYMDRAEKKWLAGSAPMSAAAYIYYMLAGLECCPGSSTQHCVCLHSTLDTGAIQKAGHWHIVQLNKYLWASLRSKALGWARVVVVKTTDSGVTHSSFRSTSIIYQLCNLGQDA